MKVVVQKVLELYYYFNNTKNNSCSAIGNRNTQIKFGNRDTSDTVTLTSSVSDIKDSIVEMNRTSISNSNINERNIIL